MTREATAAADGGKTGQPQAIYHLLMQDVLYSSDFWLHLEVNGQAKLTDVDLFLRAIWLECCEHRSRFSIGGWGSNDIAMSRKLEAVLLLAQRRPTFVTLANFPKRC